ncbi:cache domain-containing protein [Kitasatospora sp. NPDC086801]|uniref:cache domain-containing protein n=1 Tax=Kitasatospora sp. NPDC086801 TaxID=3364066 RepID=UPI0037F74856
MTTTLALPATVAPSAPAGASATAGACARSVAAAVESVLAELDGLRAAAADCWTRAAAAGRRPAAAELAALRGPVRGQLHRPGSHYFGCGAVAAPGALADAELHVEWWYRGARGAGERRLRLALDPADAEFYDYRALPWFAGPRDEGRAVVAGPQVDLLCADRYVLCCARPVTAPGAGFVGVVAGDVPLAGLERLLVPPLRALPGEAVLVTGEGRVLAASTPAFPVGSLARGLLADPAVERAAVPSSAADWEVVRI